MKPKFVKWMLFFIILAIVTAEELQKVSKIHERKIIVFQTRGLSRYSSKSITTLRPKVETISSTSDSLTSNTSRRTSEVRKNLSNRSNVSNINKRISQEQTTIKSKDEADIDQYSEKSKIFSSKAYNYESARLDPYVLDSKASISESRNNNIQNSKNSNTSNMDRRQLPENLNDKVKEAKQQDYSEINEISKFIDKSQTIGRRSTYLHNDGLKDKMKTTISSEPTKVINDSRLYTAKKIRNSTISVKQLNSVLPLNSRISRYKVNAKINLNSTLERAKSNQSSFQHLRRPILKSGSKFDITASGSESVHINIPLNFDDSKRVSSLTPINSIRSSTELPKPSSILRHRLRGRQTTEAKKISRGSSRRVNEYHRDLEVTNESFIRNRSKNDNSRKINTIIENNTTSLQLDVRKRMPKMKSLFRGSDDFRIPKTMNESQNNRKLNMSRGLYRMDVGSTIIGGPNQSQLLSLTSELLSTPGSIMKEIIVSSCIREANITSTQPKSSALLTTSKTSLQSLTTMETILNLEKNTKDAIDKDNSQQNTGQSRKALKEDFFNHGLGFRGRRPLNPEVNQIILTSTIAAPIASTTSRPENIVKGNPGWTLRRRPGHWYDSLTSRPLTNPVEASISVQNKEVTSTTVGNTQRAGRKDNKTFAKVTERENKEEACESDNYPHDFKARLAKLKKGDGKPRASVVASKMMSTELFTARSRIKLENARKLIKPELLIDETKIRHVIVYPFSIPKENGNQKTNDSEVGEDQKVFQIARKWSLSSEKPKIDEKSSISSDWKPSKLRKNLKETQSAFSRYKQAYYTLRSKVSSTTTSSITEKDITEKNYINHRFKSRRLGMFQKYRYRENKLHVPNPSHIDDLIQDDTIFTTKSSQFDKIHKMFTSRKNDKNYLVEDIKAVALKLRKPLESMEKSQSSKPPKKSDPMESSTTLLTTMRTVKSFSFSTRLVKIDDNDSINSATMKIVDNEMTSVSIPKSTSSPSVTKIITQNPIQNENTTSPYENILASNSRPSYDVINEIANFDVSSTSEPLIRKAGILGEIKSNWKELSESMDSVTSREYYQPRAAALTNDTGTPVFVVYPSATEKPMSIAITPKIFRYQATAKPVEVSSNQYQSATQKPIVNVKVSNSDGKSHTTLLQESILNSQKATTIISKSMNIFNPIKSAAILETGNITILDHLRTTVAPLLSTLAANSLLFSGVYKNTNSTNSLSRVTSSDASPKFSARFRDTEHYLRKPITATTSLSQDSDHLRTVSQIDALSSSKPKILTFYRAMETVSKSNKHTDTATTTDTVVSNRKYKNYQIIQNQIRDGVTKTSNNESQHNSIFIGQDKFDNYGIQNEPIANPDVHNKNMNSTSVEDSAHKSVVSAGPINKMIEIFSPVSNTINSLINTSIKETTTTISALPAQTATTVTTMRAKTTQTPITTTEIPITTMTQAKNTIKTEAITTSSPSAWLDNETLKSNLNTFGTTFDDLAFLNALLEKPSSDESKPKKLTEVEQLLANKILFLALGRTLMNSGSLRSPKAIQSTNRSPNSFPINMANKLTTILPVLRNSSFEPKVIDFISLSTTNRPSLGFTTPFTWKPIRTFSSYQPPFMTSMTNVIPSTTTVTPIMIMTTIQKITAPTKSTYKTQTVKIKSTMPQTSIISTRKLTTPSSVINNRPTIVMRPQPSTVQIPLGPFAFATNLLQTIFGSNLFAQTTSRPVISRPVPTVKKVISVLKKVTTTKTATPAAIPIHENIQLELSQTPRLIQISNDIIASTNDQRASILNIFDTEKKSNLVTIRPLSAKQSTTFFPEDNAKSLATLLNVARNLNGRDSKLSTPPPTSSSPLPDISSPGLNSNDFLQVLSNGQSKIQSLSIAGGNNKNNESLGKTTERPTIPTTTMTIMSRTTTRRRSRSSTYHPPLFSDFSAFGSSDGNIGSFDRGEESLRSQVVNAAIGMTRAFGQFLEAAITGAAQQFQWFVRNGTRWS